MQTQERLLTVKVKIDGLKDVQRALHELPKATGKNVVRRILRARAKPIVERMKSLAPVADGHLKKSIVASTKLIKSERKQYKKFGKNDIEVFVGPGSHPQAVMQEFGTKNHPPQPYIRPAWDSLKETVIDGIKDDLWKEIKRAADRLAKKEAKKRG